MAYDENEVTRQHVFKPRQLADREDQVRVVVLGGLLAGEKFIIDEELTFGRRGDVGVKIDDTLVSRRHARIFEHANGGHVIEDLKSRNGTQVNGQSVEKKLLAYGDRIQIGSCLFLFTHHDPMEAQVEHRRKLEAIGRLGTGVAHDFNNLLSAVSASVDFLRELDGGMSLDNPEVKDALGDIRKAASAATEMTGRLLGFAREKSGTKSSVNLSKICENAVQLVRHTFHRKIEIECSIEPRLSVTGDKSQIHQLLINLLINARDAMTGGGKLILTVKRTSDGDVDLAPLNPLVEHALIIVQDTGVGMDSDTRERAFDPFFTTKSGEVGAGLGLAAVYDIARAHNGHVTVHSEPNRGSRFRVVLPLNADCLATQSIPSMQAIPVPATRLLILLVDDEDLVRRSAGRVVRQSGHRVIFARSGDEALKLYTETKPRPDLVLMDLNMPGMTGDQAFRALREVDPQAPVVFVSGYWDTELEYSLREEGALGFVQKPYEAATLRNAIVQAMTTQTS